MPLRGERSPKGASGKLEAVSGEQVRLPGLPGDLAAVAGAKLA